VNVTRKQILTIGPVLLVTACYVVAAPSNSTPKTGPETDRDAAIEVTSAEIPLATKCYNVAKQLRTSLAAGPRSGSTSRDRPDPGRKVNADDNSQSGRNSPLEWNVIVREPFVLAGDLIAEELEEHYLQTIGPTVRALALSYFRERPRQPIAVVICTSDERFRQCNLLLDAQERDQYSGVYVRKHRRVIVNIASGEGTLAHELTHALAHADFPTMPEWFEEGLASLHEECEFSADGQHLIGNTNWRREVALEALQQGELRLLEDVSSHRFGLPDRAHIDYAYVRSFCLYLQELGVLEAFYHACRRSADQDATGLRTLCAVTEMPSPRAIDDAFRSWLIAQRPVAEKDSLSATSSN
jgi:hypothetical protein